MHKALWGAVAAGLIATSASAGPINVVMTFGETDQTGSFNITERENPFGGYYDVDNQTSGAVLGFGVSNQDTIPAIFGQQPILNTLDSANELQIGVPIIGPAPVGCAVVNNSYETCYSTRRLTAGNWNEEIAFPFFGGLVPVLPELNLIEAESEFELLEPAFLTFQDVFGAFEDVAGEDNVFNWFDFTFFPLYEQAPVQASFVVEEPSFQSFMPLGAGDELASFFGFIDGGLRSNVIGLVADPNTASASFFTANIAAVPLPAAGWMLLAGLGGLAAVGRRNKA